MLLARVRPLIPSLALLGLAAGCGAADPAAEPPVEEVAQALLGPNLLANECFATVGPLGSPVTKITAMPGPAGPSAAASWGMYSTNPCYISTELVPSTRRRGGRMIHVVTRGMRNGIVQRFAPAGAGPVKTLSTAWVYVRLGRAALGTGSGGNNLDHLSTLQNQWERVGGANGISPASSVAIFSASAEGADYYVDCTSVQADSP